MGRLSIADRVAIAPDVAETFRRQSYVHVPRLFDAETVDRLAAAVDADGVEEKAWRGGWLTDDDKRRGVSLTAKHDIHRRSAAWAAAVGDPALLALVGACLGGTPVLDQTTTVVKPPHTGQPFPMHQDSAYYGHGVTDYVIVTVYLDAMTPRNGPIQFVPGSHLGGHRPHTDDGKKYLPGVTLEDSVPVYAQPGDVTVFHIHTIHGSAPNVSDSVRRTVRVGYRRG
jgi:ectoine hydroxylase-related dioxygenase (phytanoyl-CoA dioxygenase family)